MASKSGGIWSLLQSVLFLIMLAFMAGNFFYLGFRSALHWDGELSGRAVVIQVVDLRRDGS